MALVWTPQGPRPTTRGQVEGIADGEVVGAVKAVAAHPTDPDIVYVGAVNGGVWRTSNARDTRPTWEQLTDAQQSLSLGALELDPTDSASSQHGTAGSGPHMSWVTHTERAEPTYGRSRPWPVSRTLPRSISA